MVLPSPRLSHHIMKHCISLVRDTMEKVRKLGNNSIYFKNIGCMLLHSYIAN